MTDLTLISVVDIVGSDICASAEDGQRLHDRILPLLERGYEVTISFEGVNVVIPAFLNAAIGQLVGVFSDAALHRNLIIRGLSIVDLDTLHQVLKNAKAYLSRPSEYDRAWQEEVGDGWCIA